MYIQTRFNTTRLRASKQSGIGLIELIFAILMCAFVLTHAIGILIQSNTIHRQLLIQRQLMPVIDSIFYLLEEDPNQIRQLFCAQDMPCKSYVSLPVIDLLPQYQEAIAPSWVVRLEQETVNIDTTPFEGWRVGITIQQQPTQWFHKVIRPMQAQDAS